MYRIGIFYGTISQKWVVEAIMCITLYNMCNWSGVYRILRSPHCNIFRGNDWECQKTCGRLRPSTAEIWVMTIREILFFHFSDPLKMSDKNRHPSLHPVGTHLRHDFPSIDPFQRPQCLVIHLQFVLSRPWWRWWAATRVFRDVGLGRRGSILYIIVCQAGYPLLLNQPTNQPTNQSGKGHGPFGEWSTLRISIITFTHLPSPKAKLIFESDTSPLTTSTSGKQ